MVRLGPPRLQLLRETGQVLLVVDDSQAGDVRAYVLLAFRGRRLQNEMPAAGVAEGAQRLREQVHLLEVD